MLVLAAVAAALSIHAVQDPPRLEVGKSVEGRIEAGDPTVETDAIKASFTDAPVLSRRYAVEIGEQGTYTLELRSYFFDAYLVLRDASGRVLAEDDDGWIGSQSRIIFDATKDTMIFRVDACALHGNIGRFELKLLRGRPEHLSVREREEAGIEDARAGLRVVERERGPDHLDTAASLDRLALLLQAVRNYAEAKPLFERALAIREKVLGPDHPETATNVENLALLLQAMERYGEARVLFGRALAIDEKAQGPEQRDTATDLNNLAVLLQVMGIYSEAQPLLERALAIREKVLGPMHPDTAAALNNLATLFQEMGRFSEARPLFERALAIREKASGPEDPETARSLRNLADLLEHMGNFSEARPLLERSLAISERALGPEHPDTATSLNSMATLLRAMGKFAEARSFCERALAIRTKVLGPEHHSTAASLGTLAVLLEDLGLYAEARPVYERALAIDEKALGSEHSNIATDLNNLASLLHYMGNYTEARPLYERALAIDDKVLGPAHAGTAQVLNNLALLLTDVGETGPGWSMASSAFDRTVRSIRGTFPALTEGERIGACSSVFTRMETRLALEPRPSDIVTRRTTYGGVLIWKGQVARATLEDRERTLSSLSPENRARVDLLRSAQAEISTELSKTEWDDQAAHERRLAELRDRRSSLEREMVVASSSLSAPEPSPVDLIARLPKDSAFVDFIAHREYVPAVIEDGKTKTVGRWTSPHVTAWIICGGNEAIDRIDLGEAEPIRQAVQSFLSTIREDERPTAASAEASGHADQAGDPLPAERGVAPTLLVGHRAEEMNQRVRDLLWKPIRSHLAGASRIFVSPDRFLGTFPFETLVDEDARYLVEKITIRYVSDGASLASTLGLKSDPPGVHGGSLLTVGDVNYDARGEADIEKPKSELIVSSSIRGGFQDQWGPLHFTRQEAEAVFALHESWTKGSRGSPDAASDDGSRRILGSDATEEVLRRELSGKRFIHIATHGFFQPEGLPSMWEIARERDGKGGPRMSGETERITGLMPGLLSGLVCAGANLPVEKGRDDGLLTAEEVTWLDLTHCDLVVLSACQTALGKDRAGEGMMSLQRAFQMAGAKSVIASLWNVDDERTVELMRSFYKHLWIDGQSRIDALRNARIEMLTKNRAERQRRGLPWTWGAFVLYGDWR